MAWLGTLWRCLLETCSGLCDKLRFGSACNPLPGPVSDDLLMEIFSRMPAECVHRCKVYKDWDTLFSTLYFNYDLFLPRASPTIIVHHCSLFENQLFYIDDDHRGGLKCTQISQKINTWTTKYVYWPQIDILNPIRFSCYGLLFLDIAHDLLGNISRVVNPITRRWVSIPSVSNVEDVVGDKGNICGAYFHPTAREFRVLWVSTWEVSNENKHVEFKLLRPQSEKNPKPRWYSLLKLRSRPMTNEPPVNLHDCLHWMCNNYRSGHWFRMIMVFSIIKEDFTLMPSVPGVHPKFMHLFDLDGYLSSWELTDILNIQTVNIWTVEEYYASWSWTKRYSIDVKLLHKGVNIREVSVVGCQNGALVIHWKRKGIFVYHLQHKSTKKYLFDKLEGIQYKGFTTAFLHTPDFLEWV